MTNKFKQLREVTSSEAHGGGRYHSDIAHRLATERRLSR